MENCEAMDIINSLIWIFISTGQLCILIIFPKLETRFNTHYQNA